MGHPASDVQNPESHSGCGQIQPGTRPVHQVATGTTTTRLYDTKHQSLLSGVGFFMYNCRTHLFHKALAKIIWKYQDVYLSYRTGGQTFDDV